MRILSLQQLPQMKYDPGGQCIMYINCCSCITNCQERWIEPLRMVYVERRWSLVSMSNANGAGKTVCDLNTIR